MENWLISQQGLAGLEQSLKASIQSGVKVQIKTEIHRTELGAVVLPVHGPIIARANWITDQLGLIPTEMQIDRLQTALNSGDNIIIDIDTHGGAAALAFEYAELIYQNRDRITTYTGGHATSAGQLFHAAGGTRIAHETAMMGSIGVVMSVGFNPNNNAIYSQNAENKAGNRDNLQKYANNIEATFLKYMAVFTGLSAAQVVHGGDKGGIITGAEARAAGFLQANGTLQKIKSGAITASAQTTSTAAMAAPVPVPSMALMQAASKLIDSIKAKQTMQNEQASADTAFQTRMANMARRTGFKVPDMAVQVQAQAVQPEAFKYNPVAVAQSNAELQDPNYQRRLAAIKRRI